MEELAYSKNGRQGKGPFDNVNPCIVVFEHLFGQSNKEIDRTKPIEYAYEYLPERSPYGSWKLACSKGKSNCNNSHGNEEFNVFPGEMGLFLLFGLFLVLVLAVFAACGQWSSPFPFT